MKITVNLKAAVNDVVRVENYRSIYKPWEEGTVERIAIHIRYSDPYVIYDVRLHRLSRSGNPMFLYVGDEGIEPT